MGTRAYWMSLPYRYQVGEDGPWMFAETLADIREDTAGVTEPVRIERRAPRRGERKASAVSYEPYGQLVEGRVKKVL